MARVTADQAGECRPSQTRIRKRMQKATTDKRRQDLLPEYDFRGGVRGKYARRYAEGTNIVALNDVCDVEQDRRERPGSQACVVRFGDCAACRGRTARNWDRQRTGRLGWMTDAASRARFRQVNVIDPEG